MRDFLAALAALSATVGAAQATEMNISQYVFRDINRNGVYEIGEGPLAGVPILLYQGEQDNIVEQSNLAGFTNFPMSDDPEDDPDISGPGPLEFRVVLPEGMEMTTGNPRQQTVARLLPDAPGGIIIDPPLPFMGLAPKLTITAGAEGVDGLTCESGGVSVAAEPVDDGFRCGVTQGVWTVRWALADGTEAQREVRVGNWPVRVPRPSGAVVQAEEDDLIVGFDNILYSENIEEVASGHGGVRWHNMVAVHRKFYGGWGYVNGTVSGQFAAYNSSGHPGRLYSEEPFDFIGAFVSVAWPTAMDAPLRIEAIRDGEVVASDEFHASNMMPVWFDAGWGAVDEVRISHETYWQVIIDDVRIGR